MLIDSIFRKLPLFKGKQRLAKFLMSSQIKNHRDIYVKGNYKCRFLLPNIKENIGFEIFINGVYEQSAIEFIIKQIPKNGYMIDIGANIGTIAYPVLKSRKDINAICIEASPRVFKYLQKNQQINDINNCILVNKAISDVNGETASFYSPEELFGKGSLSSVFTAKSEKVDTLTLDTLLELEKIKKIDFIKIDVEGYEYEVFKGGKSLLSNNDAPDILLEFVYWAEEQSKNAMIGAAQNLLLEYGYNLFIIKNYKLIKIQKPILTGAAVIFATKK